MISAKLNEELGKPFAVVFPGQGSQFIGMGQDFLQKTSCQAMIEEAQDVFKINLAKIMIEGPEEVLSRTTVSQPVIFLTSLMIFETLQEMTCGEFIQQIACVAGHSIGEYAALVVAKALNFSNALKLIQIRSQSMEKACPVDEKNQPQGGMCAILGLPIDQVQFMVHEYLQGLSEEVNPRFCSVVNDNCPGQSIIAGLKKNIEEFCQIVIKHGAKAIMLKVSGPFHSVWMKPVQQALSDALETIDVHDLEIPLAANYHARLITKAQEVKDVLPWQVCSPVLWRSCIDLMANTCHIQKFYELGPGKILSGLIKRCTNIPVASIQTYEACQSVL